MPKQLRDENSNEDGPSEGEKPLKKARYVWEVKGKHHLKEAYKNNSVNSNDVMNELELNTVNKNDGVELLDALEKGSQEKDSDLTKSEQNESNVETLDKSTHGKCCNNCCIQKLLENADDIMNNELDEISNEIPLTLVSPNPKNQEYYLRKWQARQIARGFVDNTINSVLETWSNRPLDAADLVDNYANDGQVEDDAILMAIQSHGLQSSSRLEQPSSSVIDNEGASERNPEIEEFTHDNLENFENERMKEQEIVSTADIENNNRYSSEINQEVGMDDTMDFLSAAVSVAIQKKGLSYGY